MEDFNKKILGVTTKFDSNKKIENKVDVVSNIVNKFDKKSYSTGSFEFVLNQIDSVPKKERVQFLKEKGVITDLEGFDWGCLGGDRFYVFANIQGSPVPMYRTSARTEGKREDRNFFPFFGVQESNQNWLLKSDVETGSNNFYGSQELDDLSRILTKAFDFNTDRLQKVVNDNYDPEKDKPFEKMIDVDNFVPEGVEIVSANDLNQLLAKKFDIDFNEVNKSPAYSSGAVELSANKILSSLE